MKRFSRSGLSSISAATLTVAFVVSGCAGGSSPVDEKRIEKQGNDGSNDPIYLSEIAADAGEETVGPSTIERSLEKFEESIRSNPKNSRARFWRTYLRLMMEFKGSITRVKPLFKQVPNGENRYEWYVYKSLRDMDPETQRFYLDGPEDISTPELWQEWLDRVVLRLAEARETLDELKLGREFQVRAPKSNFGPTGSSGTRKCESKWGPIVVRSSDCDSTFFEAYLNRADLEVLTSMISMMQTQFSILNAWRLDEATTTRMVERQDPLKSTELAAWINGGGARLRSSQSMTKSKAAVRDLTVSYRWILQNQKIVCPIGKESKKNRPGYLFAFGLCFLSKSDEQAEAARLIRILETISQGGSITSAMVQEKKFDFDFDWAKFMDTPIQNLSSLSKVETNSCGAVEKLNETALVPFLKKGSVNEMIDKSSICIENGETEESP